MGALGGLGTADGTAGVVSQSFDSLDLGDRVLRSLDLQGPIGRGSAELRVEPEGSKTCGFCSVYSYLLLLFRFLLKQQSTRKRNHRIFLFLRVAS